MSSIVDDEERKKIAEKWQKDVLALISCAAATMSRQKKLV